jgi:hypothetical protein
MLSWHGVSFRIWLSLSRNMQLEGSQVGDVDSWNTLVCGRAQKAGNDWQALESNGIPFIALAIPLPFHAQSIDLPLRMEVVPSPFIVQQHFEQ